MDWPGEDILRATARLRAIDLNLLPVLRELLRTRNITRASEALGMSQSAVSEALKRLRHQLDDEVFVRAGREMVPTPLMDSLGPFIERMLNELEAFLSAKTFTPNLLQREFVVATSDATILAIGSNLISRFDNDAPGVSVQFVDLKRADARSLETGDLDLAILPAGRLTQVPNIFSRHLYDEYWVYIAREGNPFVSDNFQIEDARSHATLAFRPDSSSSLFASPFLESKLDRLRAPHFALLPLLVGETDAFALVQRHLAERFKETMKLRILSDDFQVVPMFAHWAHIHDKDPAHIWFRAVVQEIAALVFRSPIDTYVGSTPPLNRQR